MANDHGYVELGISCADVCGALERGLEGRRENELSEAALVAIKKFAT